MAIDPNSALFNTRHPELKRKHSNWTLIYHAYLGGVDFIDGGYLIKYPRESKASFNIRKTRSVYFNQLSPITDLLSSFLFINEPTRVVPKEFDYILKDINAGKSINEFMRIVAAHSFLFTCGMLVDMPQFNSETIKTKKDAKDNNIHPYATLYLPFRIIDFNININDGKLDWVLLDNSYREHSDPFVTAKEVTRYTLWNRNSYQHFERTEQNDATLVSEEVVHGLGEVPFKFVSWRDVNGDFVSETVCEDIAMISKLIFNSLSYLDEMLAAGSFRMLAYPSRDGTVPESLSSGGVGNLSIIPYEIDCSTSPSFIGATLTDIDPFVKAVGFYMAEALKKVGLGTDDQKEFVRSGEAKKVDLQKIRALLTSGALMMGKLESWVVETAAKWEGKPAPETRIDYTSSFSDEDLQTEVTMLTELLVLPIKSIQKNATKLIVKKVMGNYLEAETLEEINKEIDSGMNLTLSEGQSKSKIDVNAAAQKIKDAAGNSDNKSGENTNTEQGVTK